MSTPQTPQLVHQIIVMGDGKAYTLTDVPERRLDSVKDKYAEMAGVTLRISAAQPPNNAPVALRAKRRGRYDTAESRALEKPKQFGGRVEASTKAVVNRTKGLYYDSIIDAAHMVNVTPASLGQHLSGKCKTIKGDVYRFATDREKFIKRYLATEDPIEELEQVTNETFDV